MFKVWIEWTQCDGHERRVKAIRLFDASGARDLTDQIDAYLMRETSAVRRDFAVTDVVRV